MKKNLTKSTDVLYIAFCFLILFLYAGYEAGRKQSPLSANSLIEQVQPQSNTGNIPHQVTFR